MDEIARKRKTKALEEISEILVGMNEATNKICDWVKCYGNEEFLKTTHGESFKTDIVNMCSDHAFSFLDLSNLFYDDVKELAKETTP